jgi:hypothetical protein
MSKNVIGDSFSITINLKWLLQLIALVSVVVYSFYSFQMKLNEMEGKIESNMVELQELIKLHEEESELKITELEETLKWYENELISVGGVSLNPLSWGKRKINE